VIGIEADWDFSGERNTATAVAQNIAASVFSASFSDEERIRSIATVRARLGWAHGDYLWYVTGGAAFARVDSNITLTSSNPLGTFASPTVAAFTTNRTGWTAGAGVETSLFGNWSAKLEYLYVDLGDVNNTITTAPTAIGTFGVFTGSHQIKDHIVRGGVNYKAF